MLVAIVNNSTKVVNSDVETMVAAIQIQLDLHVLPAWHLSPATIKFYASDSQIPGYAWTIYIIDNDTQVQGALGFHQENGDKIDGYIMCDPILSNGGAVMVFDPANPGQYTVSATLSHEVIETVGDRFTNTFCDNGPVSFCQELCDPVEAVSYPVSVNGVNVSVSDFVFPNYFNPNATLAVNGPFNYLNTLSAPFTMLAGGYTIQRTGGPGTETQVTGELMPEWRVQTKRTAFSRMLRRIRNRTEVQSVKSHNQLLTKL